MSKPTGILEWSTIPEIAAELEAREEVVGVVIVTDGGIGIGKLDTNQIVALAQCLIEIAEAKMEAGE